MISESTYDLLDYSHLERGEKDDKKELERRKWVCRDCSTEKKEDPEITGTSCPECGRAMIPESRLRDKGGKMGQKGVEDEEPQEKKFVCRECSTVEKRGPEFTGTRCPECGRPMILESKLRHIEERTEQKEVESKEKGYIYVLVSSDKPNLVKIGMTERDPEKRAKELSKSTGVAMPYIVAYQVKTPHPGKIESIVHERLSHKRVNPNREFFRVKLKRAIQVIEQEI